MQLKKKTLRILLVNSFYYYRGGDCVYMFGLSNLLQKMGKHQVVCFAMKHPLNLPSKYSEFFVPEIDLLKELKKGGLRSGIRVLTRAIYSNEAKKYLTELLNKYPVDIAHIQNIHGHITSSILHILRKRNIPIVWTLHDYFLLCPNTTFFLKNRVCEACKGKKFYKVVLKRCRKDSFKASLVVMLEEYIQRILGLLKLVDFFIAPSKFLRDKMIEYGFCPDKVIHIPNFIEEKNIKSSSNNTSYIVYSGRLSYEKGVETLIEAVSLSNQGKVLIAGDGPLRSSLEKLSHEVSPGKVKFLGHLNRERLQTVIKKAACIVIPSKWYENFPYSILEAFALGKPVIASRIGGIPEMVRDYETGLLFNPGDEKDLWSKIQWMLNHPKEREEMGKRARELVRKEYNPQLHYNRIMEVYRMAIKNHGLRETWSAQ